MTGFCANCGIPLAPGRKKHCSTKCGEMFKNRIRAIREAETPRKIVPPGHRISIDAPPPGMSNLYGLMLPIAQAAKLRPGGDLVAALHGPSAAYDWVLTKLNEASRLLVRQPDRSISGSSLGMF